MNCPKCNQPMSCTTHQGIEVDHCPRCQGVWLDRGEMEQILKRDLGTLIDQGAVTEISENMDDQPATCHRCGTPMLAMSALADIAFDYCPDCKAMFLDAGELSRLQELQG